jgi:hypothetical protein
MLDLTLHAHSVLPPAHLLSLAAAVGLSYSGVQADYATNDTATAADSNAFLRGLFRRYPHLARNDFYIAGVGLGLTGVCFCWRQRVDLWGSLCLCSTCLVCNTQRCMECRLLDLFAVISAPLSSFAGDRRWSCVGQLVQLWV